MDHHRQFHHHHLNNHPHPPRHLINSPPPSSRYVSLRPPPPLPPPFPDDHHNHNPNLFPPPPQRYLPPPHHHHPPLPPPCVLHRPPPPPHQNTVTFAASPPPPPHQHYYHHHQQQQHRRVEVHRSPPRVIFPPNPPHLHNHNVNHNHNYNVVDQHPRFRFNDLPPHNSRVSPPNFMPSERFREDFNSEPPRVRVPVHHHHQEGPEFCPLHRSDRILDDRSAVGPADRLEGAFDRNLDCRSLGVADRLEGDFDCDHRDLGVLERIEGDFQHRSLGVVDRLEGDFDRDHRDLGVERLEGDFDHRSLGVVDRFEDRVRDCDHHERYHPEMVIREEFELNSGGNECFRGGLVDDEVFVRGGRDDVVLEENIKMRRSSGGGSREVSRSPIKFRVGGMEVDDDFNNRARKEEIKDYSSHGTPRKSVQKKSAFLRIQPAKQQQHSSFRNRFDNTTSSSSPHKGKGSNFESVDSRISEERVGSPVELDLSFKSNALVAKAITAAPLCSDASFSEDKALSGSGISLDSERPSRVVRFKINSSISKKGVKDSNNRVRVSPMKRLGNLNKGQVCINHSESSPSVSRNSSSPKSSSDSEVSKKDDRNADFEKVSSPAARKKRKVITSLSRLSSVATSKVDSELVDLDSLGNHPADGSMLSDTKGKKLEKELSCSGNNIGSALNENLDMGKIDVNKSSTVVDQMEVVGQCVSVEFDSKKTREKDILHPLSDSARSFGDSASEDHGNAEVYLQGEQRISNLDGEGTKFVEKYSSEIFTEKHVEGQDMPFVMVNNGSVEGSSNSMAAFVEDHVENNDIYCESAEASGPIAVMSSTINPVNVSNKGENEADFTCRVVHCDKAGPSSLEVATVGLSLDIDNEPALRHTEANGKVGSASIDISSDKGGASLSYDGDGGTFSSRSIDPSDVRVADDFQEQECQGSETIPDDVKSRLGRGKSPKTCIYARENSSELNRKRKAETEPNFSDLRISESCHDNALSVSCPTENAKLLVEKFIPEVSGSPCVESHSQGNKLIESSANHVNTMGRICDLDPFEYLSSGGKKRKTFSTESIISDAPGSQSSEFIPLADGISVKCSSQLVEGFTLPKLAVVEEEIGGATSSFCALFSSNANDSQSDNLCKDLCLSIIESAHSDGKQPSVSEHGCNQIIDRNLTMAGANDENGYIVLESECTESVDDTGGCFQGLPADSTRDEDQGPSPVDMECDDTIGQNVNLFSVSDCPQSCASSIYGVVTTNPDMLNAPSGVEYPDQSHPSPTVDVSNADPAIQACSDEKQSMDDKQLNKPLSIQCSATSKVNLLPDTQKNVKPRISATSGIQSSTQKSVSLQSKHVKTAPISNFMNRTRRNVLTRSGTSLSTSHQSTVINPSNKTPAYPAKPRTWHRANNLVASNSTVKKPSIGTAPPHRPPYGKALKVQDTSYIRKGNSLVRYSASGAATSESRPLGASINLSKPIVTEQIIKEGASLTIEPSELPDGLVTGACSTPIEMPNTPPLPSSGKTSPSNIAYSGEYTPSLPVYKFEGTDNQLAVKPFATSLTSDRDPENVNRNLEDPGIFSDGDVLGSNSKRLIYVKHKSNQLIAASKSFQLPVHIVDKKVASSSDNNYYKRKKNQLIRASSEGNIHQMLAIVEDSSKSLSQSALHVHPVRNSAKRLSNKGKSSKHSLVWKLGDKGMDALKSGRLLSHLLPWKRATYWSRKLLSSRKRGVVYIKSGRGFSLRRSKVVSLPGRSLKWSKSMEKRSKKVEEEAAMAVVMDSVQKAGSSGVCSKVKSNLLFPKRHVNGLKLHSGERIFRIGAFRYCMDPSRRTLQRISDDELEFTAPKTQKDARKTYVPKRLLIGSNEYVRIGNGNQLVRDPKRRTRILASEKVRWSLHTARMRLAKKRKFCQFFTRFGKCNKGEGKCPFVHDPSKIAVCTKFLNGLCADSNCKLTHKVIPERMPDCSFFLQGLCSNEKCPYRHVNVNSKASICESFLKGYCVEGNECRKKHSYICPEFEASGSCPQGSQCKLYHPKKGKAKKKKVQRDQNNSRGRYFGSALSMVVDPETRPVTEKHVEANRNSFAFEGDMGDFISLTASDDDDEMQDSGMASEQTSLFGKDGMTALQLDDLDDLIKPLRILGRVIEK